MAPGMKKLLAWFALVSALLLVLCTVFVLSLPMLTRYGFERWADQHGLQGSIGTVDISLRDGRVELAQVELRDTRQQGFRLANLVSQLDLRDLWQRTITVQTLRLAGLELSLQRDATGHWPFIDAITTGPGQDPAPAAAAQASDWRGSLARLELLDSHACLAQQQPARSGCVALHELAWQGQAEFSASRLGLAGDAVVNGLRLDDRPAGRDLASLQGLAATGLVYTTGSGLQLQALHLQRLTGLMTVSTQTIQASLQSLTATGLTYTSESGLGVQQLGMQQMTAQKTDPEAEPGDGLAAGSPGGGLPLFSLAETALQGLELLPGRSLQVADLRFGDIDLTLRRDAAGRVELRDYLASLAAPETPTAPGQAGVQALPGMLIRLGHARLAGNNRVQLEDAAVSPVFRLALHDLQADIGELDSGEPAQRSPFSLSLGAGEYGQLAMAGEVAVFAPRPTLTGQATIQALNLADLTAYARELLHHRVKSGQLDAELTLAIEQGKLNSQAELTLHKFYVTPLGADEKDPYQEELGVPLTTALSLLRQKDDRIAIRLPISGDIEAPDFALDDIVNQVMAKAIKTSIISYYSPFGLLSLAGGVIDLATALRFEPVGFAAASPELGPKAIEQLQTLGRLLNERPRVHLVLCGQVGRADRLALFPLAADAPPSRSSQAVLPTLSPLQQEALLSLAVRRGEKVKQYLVNQLGIGANRLILCNPDISPDDERPPRVEIAI